MVEFVMRSPMRKAILLAAAHGMTDVAAIINKPAHLLPYSAILMPIPGLTSTLAFFAASVIHFASDIGLVLSSMLHLGLGAVALHNQDASFLIMSLYFCFVHTPLHYTRLLAEGQMAAVGSALGITASMGVISAIPALSARVKRLLPAGARLLAPYTDGTDGAIHVTHMMQKLVVAHVVVEALHSASRGQPWMPAAVPPPARLSRLSWRL